MNLPKWIKTQTADHILHFLWVMLFGLPVALCFNPLTVWWSAHWWVFREIIDQRKQWPPKWPPSKSKVQEIAVYEFAAMVLMVMAA